VFNRERRAGRQGGGDVREVSPTVIVQPEEDVAMIHNTLQAKNVPVTRRALLSAAAGGIVVASRLGEAAAAPGEHSAPAALRAQTSPKTVNYAYVYVTKTIDPHGPGDLPNLIATRQMYEALLDFKPGTFELEPVLASGWTISDDGLTYTFTLRENVTFHDGGVLDATAVKRSYERMFALGTNPAVAMKERITGIETPDPLTVVVTAAEPFAPLLATLFSVYIVSPKVLDEHSDDLAQAWLADNSAGTGPYRLGSWERDLSLTMDQFPDYWRGWDRPDHIEKVVVRYVTEQVTHRQLVEQGEVDLAMSVPIDDIAALSTNPNLWISDETGIVEFLIRLDNQRPPLDDLNFRKAIASAFDYQATIDDLLLGFGAVPQGYVPFRYVSHNPDVGTEVFDLDKAKAFLAASAYPDGASFTCTYIAELDNQRLPSEYWQANLAELGIELTLNPQPWATMVERSSSPDSRDNAGWFAFNYTQKDETFAQWSTLASDTTIAWGNYGYKNDQINELLNTALITIDDDARVDLLRQAQQIARDDAATINALITNDRMVGQKRVTNFYYDPPYPGVPLFYQLGVS
jgi:peptide/nickel transport system substrate-binding protein